MTISYSEQLKKLKICNLCPISCNSGSDNLNIVPGHGNIQANIMIVGEAPGKDEDLLSEPFQGMAGRMLDKILKKAMINREDIYITNTVKCRSYIKKGKRLSNREPSQREIDNCATWLINEIDFLVNLKAIITLGKVSTRALLNIKKKTIKLSDYMGKSFNYLDGDKMIFPCWHPSYVMRSVKHFQPVVDIFLKTKEFVNKE